MIESTGSDASMEAPVTIYNVVRDLEIEGSHTDKKEHGYLPHYDTHLGGYRNQLGVPGVLIEIGVSHGGSIRLWSRWLDGFSIVGIDTHPQPTTADLDDVIGVHILHGDVTDPEAPRRLCAWGSPDIVIDDGSHLPDDQVSAFRALWPVLKPGGWYIIEDLRTCFDAGWGGSADTPNATFDRIVGLMQAVFCGGDVAEMHCYEEIVFLKKRA
jgi:hypothetical protein